MIIQCKKCGQKYEGKPHAPFKCTECGHNKFLHVGGQALNHGPIKSRRRVSRHTFTPPGRNKQLDLGLDILKDSQR